MTPGAVTHTDCMSGGKNKRESDGANEKRQPDSWFGAAGEQENPGEGEEEGEEEIEQELPPEYIHAW